MCPCYSRRNRYPTSGKPSAQNIAACENQGKQRKLSYYESQLKRRLRKKGKKDKRLTERLIILTK